MKWQTVELGSCVREMRGGASVTDDDLTEAGFPVLHKGVIREGGKLVFDRDGKAHVSEKYATTKPTSVVTSDFVIATLRNLVKTGETLGFIAPAPPGQKYLLAQGAYGLRLHDEKLDKRYLSHLSNAWVFHKEILKRMVGSTQVHIRNSQFLQVPIPLPPLAEQKRIAGILDAADALRAKRREALAQLDSLLQATFLDLFGDPVAYGERFKILELGAVSAKITDGEHGTVARVDSGRLYLMARNVTRFLSVDLTDVSYVSEEDHQRIFRRCDPRPGDLLLVCVGATIGKVALVPDIGEFSLARSVALIKPNRDLIHPYYLLHLFNSDFVQFRLIGEQNVAAQAGLYLSKIRGLKVPVPSIKLQSTFASVVQRLEEQKAACRAHLAELDTLFASLQSRAFRGEL